MLYNTFPVKIRVDGLRSGVTYDVWQTPPQSIDSRYPDYKWDVFDPFNIAVHNLHADSTTFLVKYASTLMPREDGDTGLVYERTPPMAEAWVKFPASITIGPNMIGHIPIAIVVPKSLPQATMMTLPRRWEFDLTVTDATQTGMIVTPATVRFLIVMGE